ncbi:MAG: hypothetical protein KDD50_05500 [Bdellovibrionales bacterium]|nr:hypothetical protein [Bdellovibrionales bacterium]
MIQNHKHLNESIDKREVESRIEVEGILEPGLLGRLPETYKVVTPQGIEHLIFLERKWEAILKRCLFEFVHLEGTLRKSPKHIHLISIHLIDADSLFEYIYDEDFSVDLERVSAEIQSKHYIEPAA